MNSTLVPGKSRHTPARVTSSSLVAKVGGVGTPAPSRWVAAVALENPMAPAARASASPARIWASSPAVAPRSDAAGPITWRRSAEWPARKPMLIAGADRSTAARYSPKERHLNSSPSSSASRGMASTRDSRPTRKSAADGSTGAREMPQLPATTVVTPCRGDGESDGSHRTCAS